MPSNTVPLHSLNDCVSDPQWRICEEVLQVEALRKIARSRTEVFNFTIGIDGTAMVVESWEDKAKICSAIIWKQITYYFGSGEIVPDTYTHKYRVATSAYRIRLKYGSEVTKCSPTDSSISKLSNVAFLRTMASRREVRNVNELAFERYFVLATIKNISKTNNLYKTCTALSCPRRSTFCWGNFIVCPACDELSDSFIWNFRCIIALSYGGSEVEATVFSSEAERLFGITGTDAARLKEDDPSAFLQLVKAAEGRELVFQLCPHFYNGKIVFTVSKFFEL